MPALHGPRVQLLCSVCDVRKKMSVKKTICIIAAVSVFAAVWSESAPAGNGTDIELSDAQTVIEDTGITPETEAIPDFSLLLPLEPTALPVLADSNISADTLIQSEAPGSKDISSQDVFLEGSIGAGWPGFFSGDFQVYRNIGAEPFKLEFFHESVMGMGRHTAPDGYESQETRLAGEKQLAFGKNVLIDGSAGYEMRTDGLQGKNTSYYDLSRQNVTGGAALNWKPAERITITGTVDGIFNTQFLSSSGAAAQTCKYFGANAGAGIAYDRGKWGLGLDVKYDFGTSQSRFEAELNASASLGSYAGVAASVAALLAKQSSEDVLVPFALTVKTGPDASFIGSLSGGLRSYTVSPVTLQNATPFLYAGTEPAETVEWFGEAAADVPFYGIGVLNFSAEYAQTAFSGNRVLPDYAALDAATGLVGVTDTAVTVFDTSFGVTVPLKVFNASLGWNACWLDSTCYEKTRGASSAVTAGIAYAEDKGVWSAGADLLWAVDHEPEINLNGCFQITKTVRLELEVQDILPLITGKDRLVCDTYAERGGFAALFVKVNF